MTEVRPELIEQARAWLTGWDVGHGDWPLMLAAFAQSREAQGDKDGRYYDKFGRLHWGSPIDVGHLIEQLKTLDPHMKVSSVMNIHLKEGTKARAFGLSMSRERWDETGWLDWKRGGPECLALWGNPREPVEGMSPLPPSPTQGGEKAGQ